MTTAPLKSSILTVDDDPSSLELLSHVLSREYDILTAQNGQQALNIVTKRQPDLILLDILMPEISGFEVLTQLKENPDTQQIPVILITSLTGDGNEEKGIMLGAADYITKPFSQAVVRARVHTQIQNLSQLRKIEMLSMTDVLTGVANRRNFNIRLEIEWTHAIRNKKPLSLLMIDVDFFKNYNAAYGHLQGDELLKTLAEVLKNEIKRAGDIIARFDGEKFVALLPDTELEAALPIAHAIRSQVEKTCVRTVEGEQTSVTVSIGATTVIPAPHSRATDIISKADACLFAAKNSGRNTVFFL